MVGPTLRGVLLLGLLAATTAAQVRVSLRGSNAPRTAIERDILQLTMADKQPMAMRALWAEGLPAVPLLAAEVERGGVAAAPALSVLERLGGEAAAAVPVLHRALARAKEPLRSRLLAALARIDGPPCILVPCYSGNQIAQLGFDGKVVRRVPCRQPWAAWPLPDDRLGAISYADGSVVELTWAGATVHSSKVHDSLTSHHRLDDGDRLTTSWRGDGVLARLDAEGKVRWEKPIDAIRIAPIWTELLVVTRKEPRLLSLTLEGEPVTSVALPTLCYGLQVLPSGNVLLAAPAGKVIEMERGGKVVAEFEVPGKPNDAIRLRDGRTVVGCDNGLYLFDRGGVRLWHAELGYVGPMFVRAPAEGGR